MLSVYIENLVGRQAAYHVTDQVVRETLGPQLPALDVSIHKSDSPDLEALAEADVFVGFGFDVQRLQRHGRRLRLVHSTSAGVDRYLPLDWLPSGCKFTNSSGIHSQKAREYAVMALLMLSTRVPTFFTNQRNHAWDQHLTPSIEGKRVLIVGMGRLGCAAASAGKLLGLEVEGVSRHGRKVDGVDRVFPISALSERLALCDYLVLCCPLTPETRGLFDARAIARMKPGSGVINMARGAVVVTSDLVDALRTGALAGAVLDVFETEPLPPDAAVWDAPNLVATPHVSCDLPTGYTERSMKILARNLARLQAGERELENEVDPVLGY